MTSFNHLKLEKIIKGFANRRRLQILELLEKESGLSVENVSMTLKMGYENTSEHLRKLHDAGLVTKHALGNNVVHRITSRAKDILAFCKKLK